MPVITDLPQKMSPGSADRIVGVDTNDTSESPNGTTKSYPGNGFAPPLVAAKAMLTANSTVNDFDNWMQIDLFPTSLAINEGGFSVSASGIVVPEAGLYEVHVNGRFHATTTRPAPMISFAINGTKQAEETASSYIRESSGHTESSADLATIYNLNAGDEINLQFKQGGDSGTVDLLTASHIHIKKLG
jgi:hypothetical protein